MTSFSKTSLLSPAEQHQDTFSAPYNSMASEYKCAGSRPASCSPEPLPTEYVVQASTEVIHQTRMGHSTKFQLLVPSLPKCLLSVVKTTCEVIQVIQWWICSCPIFFLHVLPASNSEWAYISKKEKIRKQFWSGWSSGVTMRDDRKIILEIIVGIFIPFPSSYHQIKAWLPSIWLLKCQRASAGILLQLYKP